MAGSRAQERTMLRVRNWSIGSMLYGRVHLQHQNLGPHSDADAFQEEGALCNSKSIHPA